LVGAHTLVFIYHAGSDGGFALGVADVEAFDAVELGGGQLQQFGQGLDALFLVLVGLGQFLGLLAGFIS